MGEPPEAAKSPVSLFEMSASARRASATAWRNAQWAKSPCGAIERIVSRLIS